MVTMTVGSLLDLLSDVPRELEVFLSDSLSTETVKKVQDISMEEVKSFESYHVMIKNGDRYNSIVISEHIPKEEEE